VDEVEVVAGRLVVVSGDASIVFEEVEESFDDVAAFVADLVVSTAVTQTESVPSPCGDGTASAAWLRVS
jgi:hypothetical protein